MYFFVLFVIFLERLLNGIQQAKQILVAKISESSSENQEELTKHIDKVAKSAGSKYFVNNVLVLYFYIIYLYFGVIIFVNLVNLFSQHNALDWILKKLL